MLCATFGRTIRRGCTGPAIWTLSLFRAIANQAGAVGIAETWFTGCTLLLIERAQVRRAAGFYTCAGFAIATLLGVAARRATFVGATTGAAFAVGFTALTQFTGTRIVALEESALNR